MFPIVSLALDKDVPAPTALTYPELYKDLTKGRALTYKTFFIWCLIGMYQGQYKISKRNRDYVAGENSKFINLLLY